jgi:hypothetical protein
VISPAAGSSLLFMIDSKAVNVLPHNQVMHCEHCDALVRLFVFVTWGSV